LALPPFDPTKTYDSQGCDANNIYYSTSSTPPGNCNTQNFIPRSQFFCDAAASALVNAGGSGTWPALGLGAAVAAQYRTHGRDNELGWATIRRQDAPVECMADDGVHGQTSGSDLKFIANDPDGPWSATSRNLWETNLGNNVYYFFTANYMNWATGPRTSSGQTRLQVVRDVAINLANSLQDVNLGLMRYSADGQGGYVLEPVRDIAVNRDPIITRLQSPEFDQAPPGAETPLTETFYEASLYMQGKAPDYGARSTPDESNPSSIADGKYISPIQYACQKNYIVYLTDGAPTADEDANTKIQSMIGKTCANQVEPPHDNGWTPGSGV